MPEMKLDYILALQLTNVKNVDEKTLMRKVRETLENAVKNGCMVDVNLSNHSTLQIPEAINTLNEWISSGILKVKETKSEISFEIQDSDALNEIITGYELNYPDLKH
jgi:hypothetical protein